MKEVEEDDNTARSVSFKHTHTPTTDEQNIEEVDSDKVIKKLSQGKESEGKQ